MPVGNTHRPPETSAAHEQVPAAWWAQSADALLRALSVAPEHGLAAERVGGLRARYGANTWRDEGPAGFGALLWESLTSPMMVLLLAIAGVALLLGQQREALVMAFVVAAYVGVELINKGRTDRTMARLRALQGPQATVLRDGVQCEIPVPEVVVGDVVPLQSGSTVPADARLLSSTGLLVNEAPLMGESQPQEKDAAAKLGPDAPLGERPTAVFAGTAVLDGQGRALVVAVGEHTELGRIAQLSTAADSEPTPLQGEMRDLARTLAYVALGVSLLIPLLGWLRGLDLQEMLLTWLSLTFLMVPGQPPIIIAMALALASFELARQGVIVRRLRGAETLGSVNLILTDKTGTMTENRMVLGAVLLGDGRVVEAGSAPEQVVAFLHGALPAIPEGSHDPTDQALMATAQAVSAAPEPGRLVEQVGFARGGDYRSLRYAREGARWLYVAGRPEFVLERSTRRRDGNHDAPLEAHARARVLAQVDALAAQGRRVTAYAIGQGEEPQDLTFVGCAVLDDPVRPEVRGAVATLARAGVRTVMVTGDNPRTAAWVAQQVGLETACARTGADLDKLSDEALRDTLARCSVFARTTPEHKRRLVNAAKAVGHVVAVTGDGVNDAPALRSAHIGVAMGARGTDVAREAAELVLTDDNLARLPDGVAIGRKAYDNFSKGITYYLSAKAILLAIFVAPLLLGWPFPLAPIQIIATELLMDLASSTIFVTEEAEPDVMERPPRRRTRYLSWAVAGRIARNLVGPAMAILVVYGVSLRLGCGVDSARTAAFSTWLLGHILLALNLKQARRPLLAQGLLANRFGAAWLVGMVLLVLAMTHLPAVQSVLRTTALAPVQWALVVAGAVLASAWIEALKWLVWRRR
ncbi:MAG: cation-translocating P-type ATPase [Anaerolineae bacterium]